MLKSLAAVTSVLFVFIGAPHAEASEASSGSQTELALSNDTVQLRYETTGRAIGVERSRLSGTFFLSEQRDHVLSAGLAFPANLDFGSLSLAFGPQAYAALLEDENDDVMALSLGAQFRMLLNRRSGLAVSGHAYYAPDITTFGSADNLKDLAARVEIGIAPQVTAFGGMRWFEFDLIDGGGERTLQEEVFVGVGYRF